MFVEILSLLETFILDLANTGESILSFSSCTVFVTLALALAFDSFFNLINYSITSVCVVILLYSVDATTCITADSVLMVGRSNMYIQ